MTEGKGPKNGPLPFQVDLVFVRAVPDEHAINVYVVEDCRAEEVGAGVIALIKDDGDAFDRHSADVRQDTRVLAERHQRGSGAPAQSHEGVPRSLVHGCRGVAAKEIQSPVTGDDVEPRCPGTAMGPFISGGELRSVLPDVIAELGEYGALDLLERRDCRRVVVGRA